ncbi:uncharacterized protein C8A04DRAFT_37349 [Dichotomopilus funicola]|uniref:RRM domain-containing protein n=1 Tax=Dichotomopilus funicola TaxID=1934379 RepID=A0AAN6V2I1_9PEZI|nr:hypothetical protein C8A04DRAFT_37349 [Dichotomopilus funicola]
MRYNRSDRNSISRFSVLVEDGEDEDDGGNGGVMLRNFEEDSPSSYAGTSTPIGSQSISTQSSGSSGHGGVTEMDKKPFIATYNGQAETSGRRNSIAPIGTGRFNTNSNSPTPNTSHAGASDNLTEAWANKYPQFSKLHATQSMFKENNVTPAYRAGVSHHYSHSANAAIPEYPWNPTPAHPGTQNPFGTPQTDTGYKIMHGHTSSASANLQYVGNNTPSHAPKNAAQAAMATPQTESMFKQDGSYNRTEPRDFAPHIDSFFLPPPAFGLAPHGTTGSIIRQEHSSSQGSNTDPFSSPAVRNANFFSPASRRASISQALVLQSVPEDNQMTVIPQQQMVHNRANSDVRAARSTQLNKLTEGPLNVPSQEAALDQNNFPFIEATTQAAPVGYGVVKLKNIPFGTRRAEIIAFLGRNSKILNDNQEPVHIIMERVSSKTQDCYVEFVTTQDAVRAVERHRDNIQKGRPSRLGERPVEVLLSSQAALMKDLFPLAAGIWWDNSRPIIQAPVDGEPWKTFKGFVTEEEMTLLVKHVEIPQRSPYSKECPQRPYECMISTIKKLPWYMSSHITLRQRHSIYDATVKLVVLLQQALARDKNRNHEVVINNVLLKRLVTAALLCPGFSVVQKDNIAALAEMDEAQARMFNQPRFADQWVHLHGICAKPGLPLDVLEWYVAIIREETTRQLHRMHLVERAEIQRTSCYTSLYFGYIWYEIGLPTGKELGNLTLHEVARCELAVIERVLRRAFPANIETLTVPPP